MCVGGCTPLSVSLTLSFVPFLLATLLCLKGTLISAALASFYVEATFEIVFFFPYPYLQSSQDSYCFLMVTFLFKSCFWHLLPTVLSYLLLDVGLCVFGFWNSWSKNWPWTPDHWISRPFSSHLMDVVSQGFFPCTIVSGHFCELLHLSHEKSFQNRIAFDDRSTVAYFILLTVVKFFAEFSSYVFFEHPLYSSGYGRPSEWRYEISVSFSVHKKAEVIKTLWRSKTKY